jgi:hypothetical protein
MQVFGNISRSQKEKATTEVLLKFYKIMILQVLLSSIWQQVINNGDQGWMRIQEAEIEFFKICEGLQ